MTVRFCLRALTGFWFMACAIASPPCTEPHAACVVLPPPKVRAEACLVTRYVSSAGTDQNDGATLQSPWQTLARVNSETLTPGTCVYFRAGDTFYGELRLDSRDAGGVDRVVIGSYPSGKRRRAAIVADSYNNAITIYNTAGLTVQDLRISGGGVGKVGIFVYNDLPRQLRGVTIQRVRVSRFTNRGISIGAATLGFADVYVRDACIHNNTLDGVNVYGAQQGYSHTNVIFEDVHAFSNPGNPAYTDGNTGSGIIVSGVDGAVLNRCRAYWNGAGNGCAGGGPVGLWAWNSNAVVIKNCWSYENYSGLTNKDGGGFDLDGGTVNSIMHDNCSLRNAGPGYMVYQFASDRRNSGNVIANNTSIDDGGTTHFSILVGSETPFTVTGTLVHGNRVKLSQHGTGNHAAVFLMSQTLDTTVSGNYLQANDGAMLVIVGSGATATFCGNAYVTNGPFVVYVGSTGYDSLAAWQEAAPVREQGDCTDV